MTPQKFLAMKNCITNRNQENSWFTTFIQTENSASNWTDTWRKNTFRRWSCPLRFSKTEMFNVEREELWKNSWIPLTTFHKCFTKHVFRPEVWNCTENIQPIYNLQLLYMQLYWNHTSAWVFSCKLAAYFQNTFLKNAYGGLLLDLHSLTCT